MTSGYRCRSCGYDVEVPADVHCPRCGNELVERKTLTIRQWVWTRVLQWLGL